MSSQRNHVIDVSRAISVLIVVFFHGLLYEVRWVNSAPAIIPWAAPTWLYPVTWPAMIIPIFFMAGGFGHTITIDRMHREQAGYGAYLASRGRRLVGPTVLFVTLCAVVASAMAWTGHVAEAADLSRALMQLLWFLTVYLVLVALAPLMVRLHDRVGWPVMAALFVAAAGVDAWSFQVNNYHIRNINLLLVWLLVHQFGIAYQRGWFRQGRRVWSLTAVVVGITGIGVCIGLLGYPPTSVGFADLPIANVQPPTIAMVFLALAQAGLMAIVERSTVLSQLGPRTQRVVAFINALMMSVYLWHIPCIAIAALALLAVTALLPSLTWLLLSQLVVAALSLLVVMAVVPLVARIELALIPPLRDDPALGTAITAFFVLVTSTAMVWLNGTVIHPTQPWSSLGVMGVWTGAALMAHASGRRRLDMKVSPS